MVTIASGDVYKRQIQIQAIIRGKEEKKELTQSGIYYNSALVDKVIEENKDLSLIHIYEKEYNYWHNIFNSYFRNVRIYLRNIYK